MKRIDAVLIAGRHEVWLENQLVTEAVWSDTLEDRYIHDHESGNYGVGSSHSSLFEDV